LRFEQLQHNFVYLYKIEFENIIKLFFCQSLIENKYIKKSNKI